MAKTIEITWMPSETAESGVTAYVGGVQADVWYDTDLTTNAAVVSWTVRVTANASETPECWDSGQVDARGNKHFTGIEVGQWVAATALRKAVRFYADSYAAKKAADEAEFAAMVEQAKALITEGVEVTAADREALGLELTDEEIEAFAALDA